MNYHNPAPAGMLSGIPFYSFENSDRLGRDIRYMKQYYPQQVKLLAEITELVADRYDKPRSFFYDEFPDRVSTLHILKEIKDAYQAEVRLSEAETSSVPALTGASTSSTEAFSYQTLSTVAELLLLQEILLRRMKRRNAKNIFFPDIR